MYYCVHVRTYLCTCVCMYVRVYVCTYTYVALLAEDSLWLHVHSECNVHMRTYVRVYVARLTESLLEAHIVVIKKREQRG